MNAQQAEEYIGLAWEQDGNGPDSWNCWNLLSHVLLAYFGKAMPAITLGDGDGIRATYNEKLRLGHWKAVEYPTHGCGVLLREGEHPHVGVYLDLDGGGVLHALEGFGVVFTPTSTLRMLGFGRVKYYEVLN